MWKIFAGFIVFAALALFFLMKAGDKVDMQGEAGGHNTTTEASAPEPAKTPAASAPAEPAQK
jgi:hypothetical protein